MGGDAGMVSEEETFQGGNPNWGEREGTISGYSTQVVL
jgi:hypothetical protein